MMKRAGEAIRDLVAWYLTSVNYGFYCLLSLFYFKDNLVVYQN